MKKVKLGEVCEILNGFAFKSLLYVNEGIRIVRITNVQKGYIEDSDPKYYPIEYRNSIEKYILRENDLLMSLTGNVGRVGLISKTMLPAALNQRVACLRTIDSLISKEYVFQFLNSDLFEQSAIRSSNGVAQKNLSTDWLKKVEITYPSVGQQKLITSTLNLIERLICCRKEQNKKLNELVKSRFNEMFGDVILNDKEWKISKWNEILTIRNGKNQKNVEDKNGQFPIYGSGGIIGYAKDWIVKKNSVIIGRKGNINKPILVRENFWNVDTAFGLEPTLEKINSEYLFYFCQLYNFEKLNKAVTIPSLTKSDLLDISLPLPPLTLQNEFADFVAQVDKSQLAIQKSLEELETLKKSLMQEYFG
ncbi:restriction endonuclease subunit S [Streptococcus mitis]|uniref:restriction endonuclease subunit S n=1 Tax=Streptococcus mitis TaxID=28037 RepID=UPI0039C4D313